MTKASPSPTAPTPRPNSAPAAPSTTTKLTRDDLIRLGQASRPWDFLPLAAQALDQLPADLALRFLTAANLARLGLRTLAQVQLSVLPPADPDIAALSAAVNALPDDRIPPATREATARANLATLQSRNLLPKLDLAPWLATLHSTDCFKTLDGSTITQPAGTTKLRAASGLFNQAAHASAMLAQVQRHDPSDLHRIVLDGLSPHLLKALYDLTPPAPTGFAPRIIITHTKLNELLNALSTINLTRELSDPRVEVFAGPSAGDDLRAALLARTTTALPKFVLPSPLVRAPASPTPSEAVAAALTAQQTEFEALHASVFARDKTRTPEYWRARFNSPPLRILIPTTRHSTVVQHAAKDLVNALNRQGHNAQLMIEDDPYSNFSGLAYLRLLDSLDPDLIVVINYPRATLANVVPPNIPYVCWLQDAMPHLFDPAIGRAQTSRDFLAGHAFSELFTKYEYPSDRVLPISLVADPHKFHRGPVSPAHAARHTCDIAFVSHHSETPQAMFERLRGEMHHNSAAQHALDNLWPEVQTAAAESAHTCYYRRVIDATRRHLQAALGREPDHRTRSLLVNNAVVPLVDRILRHEALEWAAAIARRRRLRFHLYGKGWERHPTLAEFAKGELPHAEELRAAYRCAALHLHLTGTAITHQRVIECYLAGGFCAPRVFYDTLGSLNLSAELATLDRPPDHLDPANDRVGYTIADHPEFMSVANHLARLGHPLDGPVMWFPNARRANHLALRSTYARHHDPAFLFRDLAQTTFSSEAQLDALVTRALNDQPWRDAVIAMVARVAREHLTTDVLAQRMIDLVSGSTSAA